MAHDDDKETTQRGESGCCPTPAQGPGAGPCGAMHRCRGMAGRMALGMLGALLVGVLALTTLWVGFSHLQARSFERVTGGEVSTWDAMFLDLSVERAVE